MYFLRMSTQLRALAAATAITLAALSPLPLQAIEPNDDILGCWTLAKVLDSSAISSIDDRQAAGLVGKTLLIRPDRVTLAGESCDAPEFERHYEDTVRYLREEAHAASGRLGLATVVTVVDLACTEALLNGPNQIVIYWKGFFFDAMRQSQEVCAQSMKR